MKADKNDQQQCAACLDSDEDLLKISIECIKHNVTFRCLFVQRWWQHLSPVLSSLWHRLCDGEPLPEQLQLIADCHHWACW